MLMVVSREAECHVEILVHRTVRLGTWAFRCELLHFSIFLFSLGTLGTVVFNGIIHASSNIWTSQGEGLEGGGTLLGKILIDR